MLAADCRVRLRNFISTAPLDCPVAVVFGHPAALNWAGPGLADAGLAVIDRLWAEGFYADLIPSSEIAAGALVVGADGRVQYGAQRCDAVVLYQPQFDAVGVAAVRLDASGQVAALAAGGLKAFACGDLRIELPERADIALWRDAQGQWQGVLQGHTDPIPDALTRITKNWMRLRLPMPLEKESPKR